MINRAYHVISSLMPKIKSYKPLVHIIMLTKKINEKNRLVKFFLIRKVRRTFMGAYSYDFGSMYCLVYLL